MNWHLLELNTAGHKNVFNFHGAISDVDGELALVDPGRSDWGFMTSAAPAEDSKVSMVKSISPKSILEHPATRNTNPLILKVDIEGGEEALFRGDTTWVSQFPLIIIELHDWMLPFSGSSRSFLKMAAEHDFDCVHRGENICFSTGRFWPGKRNLTARRPERERLKKTAPGFGAVCGGCVA